MIKIKENNVSIELKRRISLLERLINAILPNLYTCDYDDEDSFVRGVADELYWLYREEDYGLQDLKYGELTEYIFRYMSDELLDYYRERCGYIGESRSIIKKVLKEETKDYSRKIENFLNRVLTKKYRKVLCGVNVKKSPYKSFGYGYDITFYFIRKISTTEKHNIMDEAWEIVYDTFGKTSQVFIQFLDDCSMYVDNDIESIERQSIQEEDKKLPSFFTRRIDHHKFEKMMRKGIPYIFYDSNSLEEFKYKLVEATLENYIHYKYDINIDVIPKEDVDTFIKYMIDVYDPVLTAYYRNFYKK